MRLSRDEFLALPHSTAVVAMSLKTRRIRSYIVLAAAGDYEVRRLHEVTPPHKFAGLFADFKWVRRADED